MLVCPIYERERKTVNERKVVIIGFRRIPTGQFQPIIDIIKDFNAHYIPEKRLWFIKEKDWPALITWFEEKEAAKEHYVEEDADYEAVRQGL